MQSSANSLALEFTQLGKSGWSGGASVLGKLPVPGRPTIWIIVGQGPTGLAVDAGGGCLDIFSLVYHFSFHTPSLWETARYRLKYCLKGPLSPNQPINQLGKSLIKSRKSRGPSTVPCGTPFITGTLSKVAPSTTTCRFLDERNDLIQLYVALRVP